MITELLLCGLFSDHMVLQRERENALWGLDKPSQELRVQVEAAGSAPRVLVAKTDQDGRWRVLLPVLPEGTGYRLRVVGSSEKVIEDVAVGEVWLASGQSNMEWPLVNTERAAAELATAAHPEIRSIKIARSASRTPKEDFSGTWESCTPQTAGQFTAVGYYFARELSQRQRTPVGIINSTWGGTRIEAWVSEQSLSGVMPLAQELRELEDGARNIDEIRAEYQAKISAWEKRNFAQDKGRTEESGGWEKPEVNASTWIKLHAGQAWQEQGLRSHGAVWYRTEIDLGPTEAGRDLELNLGLVDDFDHSFFNGELVGSMPQGTPDAYAKERHYLVPGKLVRAGKNVIAVRVFDQVGEGGLLGTESTRWYRVAGDKSTRPLPEIWKAKVESTHSLIGGNIWARQPVRPAILQVEQAPAALYNGMINPLVGYGVRGFLWYQGEANVGNPKAYGGLMRALIRDWRERWGGETKPFLFCQLAAFRENAGWPELRAAQESATTEAATGMAVLIDIGNPTDIHPRNKREVGRRLALLAETKAFGNKSVCDSGPVFSKAHRDGSSLRICFDQAVGLKTRDGSEAVLGFELAGEDHVFRPAKAKISEGAVTVMSSRVTKPVALRYAWADYLEVNFVNSDGLPAHPFQVSLD